MNKQLLQLTGLMFLFAPLMTIIEYYSGVSAINFFIAIFIADMYLRKNEDND